MGTPSIRNLGDRKARIGQFRERTLDTARTTPDVPQSDSVDLLRNDRQR